MSETFRCDDKETLVAYLYGEIDADERREVERHLRTCTACTRETEGLYAVRQDLESWLPPEPDLGFTIVQKTVAPPAAVLRPTRWAALTTPAWARFAAAVLVCAAGAAIANVQVRYGQDGLVVTTGWMSQPTAGPLPGLSSSASPSASTGAAGASDQSWRPALIALERDLRAELVQMKRTGDPLLVAARASETGEDAAIMRRMQRLVDGSEQRQREELALRLEQTRRDWNLQRQGDLMRIDQKLGTLQGRAIKTEAGQQQMFNMFRQVSTPPVR